MIKVLCYNLEWKNIILTTLNARYSHTSLGLRYLLANLKELKPQAEILEFVINSSIQTIAEQILEKQPKLLELVCIFGMHLMLENL